MDKNRKALPRAEIIWDTEGKKRSASVPRTQESEIAQLALRNLYALMQLHEPDGETSSGAQKFRLLTPQEAVERSIEGAELMFSELEARGHVIFLPPFDEWPGTTAPMGFSAPSSSKAA